MEEAMMVMDQEGGRPRSRDRIVDAATAMLAEDAGVRLSVRAVAARAGLSTGSLRYHFPSQRALQDAVLARLCDQAFGDASIHDRSISARERLIGCLRQVLAPAGVGAQAREGWMKVFEVFIAQEPTDDMRANYRVLESQSLRRIESWLAVLAEEGALPEGDNRRRARFLYTVVNGLSIERALPAEESILESERDTLWAAVDHVLTERQS